MSDPDSSQPEPLDELFAMPSPGASETPHSLSLPAVLPEGATSDRYVAPTVVVRSRPPAPVNYHLRRLTSPAWVTSCCVVLCIAYYVVMITQGVDPLMPDSNDLLKWGADYAPFTWNGQLWRLVTCIFMHAGIIHLAVNMWALWSAGRILERLVGSVGFLIMYLASGIAGSMASLWWNGSIVSVGASGAIFGVLGAFASFIWHRSDSFPPSAHSQLRSSLVSCIGFNLLLGASIPGIDQAAHVGGLIAGLILGALLTQRLDQNAMERRWRKNLVAGLVSAVVLGTLIIRHPAPPPDLLQAMAVYDQVAPTQMKQFREALLSLKNKKLTEKKLATLVEREILPPWHELRERFDNFNNVPRRVREPIHQVQTYLALREESWRALVQGIRQGDSAQIDAFKSKFDQANKIEDSLKL